MGTSQRSLARAARSTDRQIREIADELRGQRLAIAASQAHVARSARMSRTRYGLIERGESPELSVDELNRIAAVLGLSPSIRLYPDGVPIRDIGHATRLRAFLKAVQPPLAARAEVPLPSVDGRFERRAWDAVIYHGPRRCAIELEMRLRDAQAALRRIELKRRDDPTEAFLLLVADTRGNRRVLAEFEELFADLPRLGPSRVRAELAAGRFPPTGLLLV